MGVSENSHLSVKIPLREGQTSKAWKTGWHVPVLVPWLHTSCGAGVSHCLAARPAPVILLNTDWCFVIGAENFRNAVNI
jgi:hypothetical protein